MTEYIKKKDVVILLRGLNGYCVMQSGRPNEQIKVAIKTIKALPKEDVAAVVRCKDCKYWNNDDPSDCWIPCIALQTDKNWFCASGKRREE